ncbi:MAG: hypothetical protein AB7I19_08910 [Planctomycetota bacterium]
MIQIDPNLVRRGPVMGHARIAAACLAVLNLALGQDAKPSAPRPAPFTRVTTPDGSDFVLVRDGRQYAAPVVHWVTWIPTGPDEDLVGAEGLARAVVRASLDGSASTGSIDGDREQAALDKLDELQRLAASATGIRASEIAEDIPATVAAAAALGIPDAWRRALARAGALEVELEEVDGASLLIVTFPTEALPEVAVLQWERREEPLLRGLREHFVAVRESMRAAAESPSGRMIAEVLGATFPGAAAARPLATEPRVFSRNEALNQFRAIHHPSRCVHVLSGGFDPEVIQQVLTAVFAATKLPATAPPPRPTPAASLGRHSVLAGGTQYGVAIAWPLPAGVAPATMRATADWLAGGRSSLLAAGLRGAGLGDVSVRYVLPLPDRAEPGLLLLEILGELRHPRGEELEPTALKLITAAAQRGPTGGELSRVHAHGLVESSGWRASPRATALAAARAAAAGPAALDAAFAAVQWPGGEELKDAAARLEASPQRTVVVLKGGSR